MCIKINVIELAFRVILILCSYFQNGFKDAWLQILPVVNAAAIGQARTAPNFR